MRNSSLAAVLTALLPIAGCSPPEPVKQAPTAPKSPPATANVDLQVLNVSGIDELVASHLGKVVVVDLWALW